LKKSPRGEKKGRGGKKRTKAWGRRGRKQNVNFSFALLETRGINVQPATLQKLPLKGKKFETEYLKKSGKGQEGRGTGENPETCRPARCSEERTK